jgi:hypothetical protein
MKNLLCGRFPQKNPCSKPEEFKNAPIQSLFENERGFQPRMALRNPLFYPQLKSKKNFQRVYRGLGW